ncbi:MAG: SDR family oxidoreductase [Gammaproteobacteria bacterium]|nr:SDR family NAD(P)-dependent oxidoreductase [Gammaproteobacteria bacterium]MXW19519.1 SDR family oxidoreductase [Gammaproteobacteria bacterium]MYH33323.1 SDR family oxidoreductase [Gammaproteobacteria bacterium]MYL01483.1 SDR family oxidoreductase [Gammaproteobacteria bacterium]
MATETSGGLAIVTGASRGIGRALAIGLAEAGYRLALVARDEDALSGVQAEILGIGPGMAASCHPLDVTDAAAVRDLVSGLAAGHEAIDVLVNNAGQFRPGSIEADVEDLDAVVGTNLKGAFLMLKAVVPVMKAQKRGHIINLSSITGKWGYAGYGIYAASKFALQGLSESLYKEMLEHGVKVTAICPNWVATEMAVAAGGTLPPEDMIQLDDLVRTVSWLLSLSKAACPREVVIDCMGHPYDRNTQ